MTPVMTTSVEEKEQRLRAILRTYKSALVAFSGGVDSAYLLKIASEELGQNVLAVTALSSTYPERERREAQELAERFGCRQKLITSEELDIPEFAENPVNRCYFCKKELFGKLVKIAEEEHLAAVLDGSNADDDHDYRPGRQAVAELKIQSPLKEAGLTKDDIRALSKRAGLPNWDKPPQACLSSRFPYGEKITREGLKQVEQAEDALLKMGFKQVRVRHHGNLARLEISQEDFFRALELRREIHDRLKALGWTFVTLDLLGYRTGSLNETLLK